MVEEASIIVDNVTKIYSNGVVANRDVSLRVNDGEIVCLAGPNGAGKTTLIRQVIGLLKPTKGRIRVLGVDPLRNREIIGRSVGYVPQAPLMFPAHKVLEVIEYVASLTGRSLPEIEPLINTLGLSGVKDRLGYQLSMGQRKLLLTAIALVKNPKVLVLDEPTSYMDLANKQVLWSILGDVKKESSILLVSHDIEELKRLCDRICLMMSGRIIFNGSLSDISPYLSSVELRVYSREKSIVKEKLKRGVLIDEGGVLVASYKSLLDALNDIQVLVNGEVKDLQFVLEYPSLDSSLVSLMGSRGEF